ncbi:MAG: hypothetical protein ACK56F_23855, partial [bacterium]
LLDILLGLLLNRLHFLLIALRDLELQVTFEEKLYLLRFQFHADATFEQVPDLRKLSVFYLAVQEDRPDVYKGVMREGPNMGRF